MKIKIFLLSFAKKIGFLTVLTVVILGTGFLIALPLWLAATEFPGLYNIIFLSLLCLCILFLVIRRIRRSKH